MLKSKRDLGKVTAADLLLAVVASTAVALLPVGILLSCLAVILLVPTLVRAGLWRTLMLVSFASSLLRSNARFAPLMNDSVWYVAQFGPIAVSVVLMVLRRRLGVSRLGFVVVSMALLVGFALLSFGWSIDPPETLSQALLLLLMALFLCLTATQRWYRQDVLRRDLATVFIAACAAQVAGLVGGLAGASWAASDYDRFQGLMSNANFAGMLSAVALPLAFYLAADASRVSRLALLGGSLVLGYTLLLSGSRGALLGCLIGIVVAASVRIQRRRAARIAYIASLIAILSFLSAPSIFDGLTGFFSRAQQGSDLSSGRISIYTQLLEEWRGSPIIGTGFGTAEGYGAGGVAGHNIYLSLLSELGVVGALLFANLIFAGWRASAKSGRERALAGPAVAVLVVELTESSLFGWGGPTALFSWILLFGFAASGQTIGPRQTRPYLPVIGVPPRSR